MAGICIVCKSTLQLAEHGVSLCHSAQTINSSSNTNGFDSDLRLFCHRGCFVCSACKSPLQDKFNSYSVSLDDRLFCSKHSGSPEDELLLRALSEFKAKSLALKAALENEGDQDDLEAIEEVDCTYSNTPLLVQHVAGYRVECVESHCVKRTSKQTDRFNSSCDLGSSRIIGHVTSIAPEEFYRQYFYGMKHWNYCTNEEEIGPITLTLKSGSTLHSKGQFRIMVRSPYYLVFGLLSLSNHHTSQSNREEMVQFLTQQIGIVSPLKLITAPSAPAQLLKMDMAFIKEAFKFGVVYMKEDQDTEEQLFGNESHSQAFDEFLDLLGERVKLQGFDKYRAGLDNNNDLTGKYSVYTKFANSEIMFHVSTLLPFEESDPQKLQRKRHIGNDIVCIVFMDATKTKFIPGCIKSNFLHSFIIVQVDSDVNPNLYTVSVVSRDNVPLYGPLLCEKHVFEKMCGWLIPRAPTASSSGHGIIESNVLSPADSNAEFRDWILRKLIQGEQACHRAPNFAKLHARTRSQIMGQILKSVEKSSHTTEERKVQQHSMSSSHVGYQESEMVMGEVWRDFSSTGAGHDRGDKVAFLVGSTNKRCFVGVKSVMAGKSKVFHKMFFQDLIQTTTHQQTPKADPSSTPPVIKRTISWTRSNPSLHTGLRSRKFNLEKMRRSKSESDNSYQSVTLASVTDLESRNEHDRLPATTQLRCQELVVQEFDWQVFEALLEFLHTGSCDLVPSLLPGLLCAAEHYQVDDLRHVCVDRMEQCITAQTACDMLNYLDDHPGYPRTDAVREKIVDCVSQVSPSILECSGFTDLSEENVQFILSRSHKVNKTVLFHSILEWAKAYSKKNDCQKSVEELAQPLMHKFVNVHQISTQELQEVVQPSGLVPSDSLRVKMQRDSITDTQC